ncbi:MAG TPA: adenylyl-sulfate kinase, partial [Beijerinckiaceae bacterium]|nr:adenylyl-sulfate kinase [Beijerinckiaceae bacterium]
ALEGKIKNFTGLDQPYETPPAPEILLDTTVESADQLAERVINWLKVQL